MIVYINAVYFRLFIDLMHITPPVTAEGYDGSHHPRYAEWEKVLTFITTTKLNYLWSSFSYYTVRLDTSSLYKKKIWVTTRFGHASESQLFLFSK